MENTKSYVVNMVQHDKEVEIWTKECGEYFWYTIPPEYVKNTESLMLLIQDEDLNEQFLGDLVEREDVDEYEYTLQEVKDNLVYYRRNVL
ncbi:TPA: hypothetical protein PEE30_002833 [Staphylococcus aureus]|uniref:hypothetical protein n=2 Tax=Staphylococcus chromogenes TaxID=46126 RepID=UPI00188E6C28|nr:hypothetical protein [Staphylococcus chromogenes]HDF3152200.1 hypothetical protein [Staphylococcus aureus]